MSDTPNANAPRETKPDLGAAVSEIKTALAGKAEELAGRSAETGADAVSALGKTAAKELGRFGVRVNVVAPGYIETPMTRHLPPEITQRAAAESALGRIGKSEEVADAILFLCSPLARYVTGQVLRVDGGQLT